MSRTAFSYSATAALLCLIAMITSCDRKPAVTGEWRLTAYADLFSSSQTLVQIPSQTDCILTFTSPSTFTFTTDCNTVSGEFKAGVESICFSEVSATEIACDQEVVERSVKADLVLVNSYMVEGDSVLTLADGRGNILLKFNSL